MTDVPEIRDFTKRQVFSLLWTEINKDVDEDDVHNPIDAVCAKDWMEYRAFPLLFPDHCFRCHGYEGGPCEKPDGHGTCPGCVKERQAGPQSDDWCGHCEHTRAVHKQSGCCIKYPQECMCGGFSEPQQYRHGKFCVGCRSGEHAQMPDVELQRYDSYAPDDCMGPPCGCPEAAHE